MNTASRKPLKDIRVLDFTHAAAGPFTTMFLGDMGAEVIKVEKPGRGDGSRYMGEPMTSPIESDYYLSLNRNKKGICIDISVPEGVKLVHQLVSQCDIVMQNFRPGVMERLGVGYEDLRKHRKGLIYCSISAFGSTGPWCERPANDIIMQSVSGLMGITGEVGGGPVRIGAPISDFSSGLFALSGLLAAVVARASHPEGQHVQVSMLDSSFSMMCNYIPSVVSLSKTIPRLGRGHAQIVPYQAFKCSDDEYVMVGAFTNGFWRSLCKAVGHEEWIADPRYISNATRLAHRKELMGQLEQIFASKNRAQWLAILDEADVPNSPVLELHDAVYSDQAVHNGVVQRVGDPETGIPMARFPVKVEEWSGGTDSRAPAMGTDTRAVLVDLLGLDTDSLGTLEAHGVIAFDAGGGKRRG